MSSDDVSEHNQMHGDGVMVLRPWRGEDADDLAAGCGDPLTQRLLPMLASPYTRADAVRWINKDAPAAFADGGTAFAFADPTTDRMLGGGGYRTTQDGTVEMRYWVAPLARGPGVATAATRPCQTRLRKRP